MRAYPLQTHEMLFDALTQAFRVLGGAPKRGIFDREADQCEHSFEVTLHHIDIGWSLRRDVD